MIYEYLNFPSGTAKSTLQALKMHFHHPWTFPYQFIPNTLQNY